MATLNFPDTTGQPTDGSLTYTQNNVIYSWNGTYWAANVTGSLDDRYVNIDGDTMTGDLTNNTGIKVGTSDEIQLNADGTANFTSINDVNLKIEAIEDPGVEVYNRIISLGNDGTSSRDLQIQAARLKFTADGNTLMWADTTPGQPTVHIGTFNNGTGTSTIELKANGSAKFASTVKLSTFNQNTTGGNGWSFGSRSLNVQQESTGNTGNIAINVYQGTASRFKVLYTGTVQAVNTSIQSISSERRLKENIVAIDSATAWNTVKDTPFYAYNFIGFDSVSYGPMADEVPDEMRIATDQTDDVGVIHTFDNGMLQARLYVALQTALTRIEELEARLDAAGA